jgi:nucleoside-diphosphate-sugar epimerase
MGIQKKIGRPRILIVGCGDIGMRLLPLLCDQFRVFALIRHSHHVAKIRALGATPIVCDLDCVKQVRKLAGLAHTIIYLAPPSSQQQKDQRVRRISAILPQHGHLVYISTSGVYGDCAGNWVDETRPTHPQSARAQRRVDAEQVLRKWAVGVGGRLHILRVPGIYAGNRLPRERLLAKMPVLTAQEDVYTNHIHADDLARLILCALQKGKPNRVYHAVDHSQLLMGDYLDSVADALQLSRPPRLSREIIQQQVTPMMYSFMQESRRLSNQRIVQEWAFRFLYGTVQIGLKKLS